MKLAITQIILGILLIAGVVFFTVAILPDLLHIVLPPDEASNITREIDINAGFVLPAWLSFSFLLSCGVLICGIYQYRREKRNTLGNLARKVS